MEKKHYLQTTIFLLKRSLPTYFDGDEIEVALGGQGPSNHCLAASRGTKQKYPTQWLDIEPGKMLGQEKCC